MTTPWLVADVGGTNARFALVDGPDGTPERVVALPTRDYSGLAEAAAAYLAEHAGGVRPGAACLAIAGPVVDGRIHLTNAGWATDTVERARAHLGIDRLTVINDFEALAWSLPGLRADDLIAVGGALPPADGPRAVLGPGTGMGVAGLVPVPDGAGGGWVPVAGEGGHVDVPAGTDREIEIMRLLRAELGVANAEYLLSGSGLARLYRLLAMLNGVPAQPLDAAAIVARRDEPACAEALAVFCGLLGSFAGNVALTLGARGGVYLAGGILPRITGVLEASDFRRRFEDKPPVTDYLKAIPTALIVHPYPALVGATLRLAQERP
ncbi:glucokinase [Actinomadura gamaensis]|uniref:Glucokinase n=1 Tax=Actinomadura gamaensis TaxID=1763541 RepID=A0ABV9U6A2_9ACTN